MVTDIDPIVVTGSPRSGTTLMTKVLEQMGFFMGFNMNTQFEDWYFVKINEHIMDRLGVTWDRPFPRESDSVDIDPIVNHMETSEGLNVDIPWGFKDPRTTIVRDQWEQVFDRLDIEPMWLRMIRHPMDMTVSLCRRENRKDKKLLQADRPKDRSLDTPGIHTWPVVSRRAMKKEGAFDLVCEYQNCFLDRDRVCVEFEGLVKKPEEVVTDLADVLNVNLSQRRLDLICDMMNSDRALAFQNNPELVNFWDNHHDRQNKPS